MKRLSVVFVTLAVLAMALAGCSNPVSAPNSPTSTGEFTVTIDMDQAKGLYDYQVLGVFIKGFEIDDNGAPIALQNTSAFAKLVPTSHKYVTALTPVYDERKPGILGKHVEFTRKQLGWSSAFRFDTILEPNRALKFVAWAIGYDGAIQQLDASKANDAWRKNYMESAMYENDAWDAVADLGDLDAWINTKIADAITIYNDSGTPLQYPPVKWLPVKNAIDNLDAKYHLYIEKLDEIPVDEDPLNVNDILQYQEWLELGPTNPVESNPGSTLYPNPAWAQKLAYEAAYAAYQMAHTFYQTSPDPAPAIEPKIPTVFTDAIRDAIEARHDALQTGADLFNAYDGCASEWAHMRDNTPIFGSMRYLYDMIALGEATGHRVIYHTEADRYFRLPFANIHLVWTDNNFMVGNVGPGGGMVVFANDSTYPPQQLPDLAKAPIPGLYSTYVNPKLQPLSPLIVEVAYKDASSGTSWYWNGNGGLFGAGWLDFTMRDKFIDAVIVAENSVTGGLYSSNPKNGYNGVTDWTLPKPDQISAYAYYLDVEGYSNGNLAGGKNYYTYDPSGTETRYGYITPDYDENTVLETPIPYARINDFGFPNNTPAIVGNVRLAKAWYKTNCWVSNNLVLPLAPPVVD